MKPLFYVKKITVDLSKIQGAVINDAAVALYQEGEAIMTASKRYYVPVDTGTLRNSGTVLKPVIAPNKVTVTLGYGGAASKYAAVVHEYPKSYGQGKNKYLSIPANIAIKNMASRIAKAVERSAKARRNP